MDLKTVIDSTPTLKKPRRTFTAEFKHQLIQQCQQPDTSVAKVAMQHQIKKGHVVHGSVFVTRKEANAVLFDYIEIYYNRVRRHSANGWLSPEAFEQKYIKSLEGSIVHDTV